MTSIQASILIDQGMNKLASSDSQNIPADSKQLAINTATQRFVRRRLPVKERDSLTVEDIQILLKSLKLSGSARDVYFLSHSLPSDYLGLSSITATCSKGKCTAKIDSEWVEDSNTGSYLSDWGSQPSFDFEQAFHVLYGNKLRVYHNKDFDIKEIDASYYRQPQRILVPGAFDFSSGKNVTKDMTWEWKDDVADQIIEEAIWILSGNTGDYNRSQISGQVISQQNK